MLEDGDALSIKATELNNGKIKIVVRSIKKPIEVSIKDVLTRVIPRENLTIKGGNYFVSGSNAKDLVEKFFEVLQLLRDDGLRLEETTW